MGILGGRRKTSADPPGEAGDTDEPDGEAALRAWAAELARVLLPPDLEERIAYPGAAPRVTREQVEQLVDEVVRHVVTGDPPGAPAGVVGHAAYATGNVAYVIGLSTGVGTGSYELYRGLADVPPAVGLRYAQLLEAAFGGWLGSFCLSLPGGVHWPEVLLAQAANAVRPGPAGGPGLTMGVLEALQVEAGWPPATVLVAVLRADAPQYRSLANDALCGLPDVPEAIARHADTLVREFPAKLPPRGWTLTLLERADDATLPRFAVPLSFAATSGGREQRARAAALLERCGTAAVGPLRDVVAGGKPDERVAALGLLHATAGRTRDEALRAWVVETAAGDRAASVRRLAEEWTAVAATQPAVRPYEYEVPAIDWRVPVTAEVDRAVRAVWDTVQRKILVSGPHTRARARPEALPTLEAVRRYVASDAVTPPAEITDANHHGFGHEVCQAAREHWTGALPAAGLVKVLAAMADVALDRYGTSIDEAFEPTRRETGRPTLLELAELVRPFGVEPATVVDRYCHEYHPLAGDWPDADVWPFFAHHLGLLEDVVARRRARDWGFDPTGPFRALGTLPWLRPSTVDLLFAIALGPSKTDRPQAQALLDRLPGTAERVLPALADGRAEVRILAAQWLGRSRHEPAVPLLERAFRTERQDAVRAAILDALQALGRPVERYLDRHGLTGDAERALRKGVPAALAWFPWERLPAVRWADDGTPVPGAVLRLFLVQAAKAKTSVPNALLRKYCALFEPRDREAFGTFVLAAWLAEDVRPITPAEARQRATADAQMWHNWITQLPQAYVGHPYAGRSVAEIAAMTLPGLLQTPAGSATASKGVLAVVAACGSEHVAPTVEAYLRRWYGMRLAQCKALVAMLAWVDHRSATQLMLAIGSRFRTKGIQEEARRQAEELAERSGWTVDELADRTAPTAGFDEKGEQLLDYGPRAFTAVLGADLTVTLRDPSGAPVKALPPARQTDDAELAAAAKKTLAATRKELKSVVTLQTRRLYEAMCTGRGWTYQDWHDYLLAHPVVRQLVQRLVWVADLPAGDGDGAAAPAGSGRAAEPVEYALFRPLDDATLTDVDDDEVTLPPGAVVRVAHVAGVGAEAAARWQGHLADYDVTPLFAQFGRGSRTVPEPGAGDTRVTDVEGHLIETFALRGRATKLGWVRGQALDGGVFTTYTKDFAGLGLQARIEFTGSALPEENRTAALVGLEFARLGGRDAWNPPLQPLRDVPPVLLAECYQDLWLIAADGSGHDPDWEKKATL